MGDEKLRVMREDKRRDGRRVIKSHEGDKRRDGRRVIKSHEGG